MACSPATPAPMTKTLAGARVPAAVVSIGRMRPIASAPISTALYPAIVACEESASIDCAFVVRGTSSIAKAVTLRPVRAARRSPEAAGARKLTSAAPSRSWPASSGVGRCTLRTRSAPSASAAVPTMVAPAASYSASGT